MPCVSHENLMANFKKISRSKNSTSVKVGNKNYNRNVKSGKVKRQRKRVAKHQEVKDARQNKTDAKPEEPESDGNLSVDDMLDEGITNVSFPKRKLEDNEHDLEDYEKQPRNNNFKRKKMKYLLPLKDDSGLILQQVEWRDPTPNHHQEIVHSPPEDVFQNHKLVKEPTKPTQNLSFIELCAQRELKLKELKEKVGVACSSIVENPEENLKKIKEVLNLLDVNDPGVYLSVRKLASLSLVEVFKDIVPTYRIRSITDKEKGQKSKKETRQLQEYEQSLLRYYKQFLVKLEKMLECLKSKYKSPVNHENSEAKVKARYASAIIAIKCFAELLMNHSHFNFSSNILKVVVERLAHKDPAVRDVCSETMARVFKNDKVGEISLEAVKLIKKLIKSRNFNVPANVLKPFLSLNVKEAEVASQDSEKNFKKATKQIELSRKEKKHKKKLKELENELREAEAVESKAKKSRFHTEILKEVFLIYFCVLKGDFNLVILTPVLEGLSKFAHLINVEFFDDLIAVLYKMLESDKLGFRETLHCLSSVFTILSGQGDSLNIDPQGFYQHLYKCLLQVNPSTSDDDIKLLLHCTDLMIIQRRKKITQHRALAFLKRVATIALFQNSHVTLSLLSLIRQLFMNFKQSDVLLDTENSGSGQYNPDLEDPEYCHAGSTVLWELHQMSQSHHPVVVKYSKHLLSRCPSQGPGRLHPMLALKSPIQILEQFNESKAGANFSLTVQPNKALASSRSKKLHQCVTDANSVTSRALQLATAS